MWIKILSLPLILGGPADLTDLKLGFGHMKRGLVYIYH